MVKFVFSRVLRPALAGLFVLAALPNLVFAVFHLIADIFISERNHKEQKMTNRFDISDSESLGRHGQYWKPLELGRAASPPENGVTHAVRELQSCLSRITMDPCRRIFTFDTRVLRCALMFDRVVRPQDRPGQDYPDQIDRTTWRARLLLGSSAHGTAPGALLESIAADWKVTVSSVLSKRDPANFESRRFVSGISYTNDMCTASFEPLPTALYRIRFVQSGAPPPIDLRSVQR